MFEPLEDRRVLAVTFVDPNPALGNQFGHSVVALSTGNVVITSPFDDAGGVNAGAVYLFNGSTGALISTLRGSTDFDLVGSTGVTALSNGNFVVSSASWHTVISNVTSIVGAVTWGSGTTGVSGTVSASNSLVGTAAGDAVGSTGNVQALPGGNYVIQTPAWDNGATADVGAVTWANGATGRTGTITSANSLVGTVSNDRVGSSLKVLTNGNYVVTTSSWLGGTGAVTWANGTTGITGAVSSSNSLVGGSSGNEIGNRGIVELTNGNFVVFSPNFDNGGVQNVGAVTWMSGTAGLTGVASAANSLVGSTAEDQIGQNFGVALTNGNYVVSAPNFDVTGLTDAGAAIWGSGTTGVKGTISSANALVGVRPGDQVSISGIVALTNGNYVVNSPAVDSANFADVGAATWGNGTTGGTGQVTIANSLLGNVTNDKVGSGGVTALSNGHYVVASPLWDSGVADLGAVTWGNGTSGSAGFVNSSNSTVGTQISDQVGSAGAVALTNGNYIFGSSIWKNTSAVAVGAVTWRNGSSSQTGSVSAANSLIGSTHLDIVGDINSFRALPNGNYVALTPNWDNGGVVNVGAVTWGNGATGVFGPISSSNSLLGAATGDRIGSTGLTRLPNGNYVVVSTSFDNGSVVDAGAVTWANGSAAITGTVSIANSLVGSSTNDQLGLNGIVALSNSNYIVSSMLYDFSGLTDAGTVAWASGTSGIVGTVNAPSVNHVKGLTSNTSLQQISVDSTNGNFYARFVNEVGGVVRVGSQTQGFDIPITATLTGAFSGANFTVTDIDAAGRNNTLTVSRVNVSGVDYYQFADPNEAFASAPVTTPPSTLSNSNRTLRVPVSAITGSLTINLQGGNDLLIADLASGDVIPAGGLQYLGGAPTAAPGDRLIIAGGNQGDVSYNYTSASGGTAALANFGTITYSSLELSISNTGTVADMYVNLPTASSNTVTLGDDATSGNATSRLSGATLITTDFNNPTGTLTILRGTAADTFTFAAAPDLTPAVALGTFPEPFADVTFAGALTLGGNKSLTAYSSTTIAFSAPTSDLATTGTGNVTLSSARNIVLTSGATITTAAGNITLDANQQPTATTGDFIGIALDNADLLSTSGGITVRGRGGNGGAGSQYGVRVMTGAEIGLGTSGPVTVQGTGGASAGSNNFGVLTTGAGAAITSGGGNVIVTGTGGGSGASGNNVGVGVEANSAITAGGSGAVNVTGAGSSATGANSGVSVTGTGSRITSSGGNVSVTGTATGATAQSAGVQVSAVGTITAGLMGTVTVNGTNNNTATNSHGVHVTGNGSSITSNGGAVSVTGLSGGSTTAFQNFGVIVDAAGLISSGGTGAVTVTGTGRNATGSGSQNVGVIVTGSNARITSSGGNVSVTGTGGGGASSANNYGVSVANNSQLSATGAGILTITATGGTGSAGANHGLFVTGSGSLITAAAGGININATAGAGTSSLATNFTISGGLTTSSTGNVNLAGDSFSIDGTAFINVGTNNIILRPRTASAAVNVGGAEAAGTLGLTDAELDRITAGLVQVGDAATGAITVSTAITSPNSLALLTGLGINVQNSITPALNRNFSATASGTVTLSTANSDIALTGTGTANITTTRNIQLLTGSSITTASGNLSLSANQQTTPDTNGFKGIEITSASVFSSGTGNVTLSGRGGAAPASTENHGVMLIGAGALVTSGGGNVQITGRGGGSGNSNTNYGVFVFQGAEVRAGGAGTVTIDGFGGRDLTSSDSNVGVRVEGANSRITSGGGNVTVTGRGGINSSGNINAGVWARQGGVITSGGTASTNVIGFGGGTTSSSFSYGVIVDLSSQINSNGGNVNVTGTGGIGSGSRGVLLTSTGLITASGTGNVTVNGTGGSGGSGSGFNGIEVGSLVSAITSSGGNVVLNGVAGSGDFSVSNFGVAVLATGVVEAGGAGSVTVTAVGGRDDLNNGSSRGLDLRMAGSRISAGSGGVTVTASSISATDAPARIIDSGTISTTGGGAITIASDGLLIDTSGSLNAGAGAVTLKPKTAGAQLDVGGPDLVGLLAVSDAEFDAISAGTINFGDNTTGPVNVTLAMTRATATNVTLNSASTVNFTTGTLDTAGGNVTLNPGTHVSPANTGVEITTGAGTVGFGTGDDLRLVLSGLSVDTQYQQLNVAGKVDLTGADLVLVGTLVFTGGERFTVVNNDGTDDIIGTFNGLPEGATVSTNFLGSGSAATISYIGGTGNDAVITVGQPPGTTSVAIVGGNLVITDINGGTTDDRITIGRNGANIRITDPFQLVEGGNGTIFVSPNTVEVPLASITGNIQVDSLAGDDWLIVDFVTGNPLPIGGLLYSAGAGSADRLIVQSGTTTSVVHTISSGTSGSIALAGALAGTISYSGVEPITDTVTATNRSYLLGSSSETITLTDADGFANTLSSTLGWNVTFANPVDAFTLDADAGDDVVNIVSVDEDGPFNPSVTIHGGTGDDIVNVDADITLGPGRSLDLDLQNDDAIPGFDTIAIGTNANLRMSGTGAATLRASRNISLASGSSVLTVGGNIVVEANLQTTPASGSFAGVNIDGGTLQATGAGVVTVRGRGGDSTDWDQVGVLLNNGGAILGGATGNTVVQGTGGAGTGNQNHGVRIQGTSSQINSAGANVQVTGTGGGSGTSLGNRGVDIDSDTPGVASISAGGLGTVTVTGTGSNTRVSPGVRVGGIGGVITSSGGAVQVTGLGGNGSNSFDLGVWVDDGGTITSGPNAAVTVQGTGGNSPNGINYGVLIQSLDVVDSKITTGGGSLTITGVAGNGAAGSNVGVFVGTGGQIAVPGASVVGSTFSITGVGGQGATGGENLGVYLGGDLSSPGPSVTIDATSGNGPNSHGMFIGDSVISMAGTGVLRIRTDATVANTLDLYLGFSTTVTNITHTGTGLAAIEFVADSVQIDPTVTVTATDATVRFVPYHANRLINLGSIVDTTANTLELSDAELDRFTAAQLQIGDSTAGALTISAPITRGAATVLNLQTAGAVNFAGGSLNSNGGNVSIDAGTTITPGTAGVDVTTGATGTLSFGAGDQLVFNLTGTAVDTQYQQLNVVGRVNLTGAALVITGTAPVITDSFVLVNNDLTDAVVGNFNTYPDGAAVNVNGIDRRITYVGGTGNDVVILAGNSPPTLDPISPVSVFEDATVQTVNLTGITAGVESQALTVSATSGSPTIIANPTISYTSPNATATLSYTPLADQVGPVVITVTVRDAGNDGVMNNADDELLSRQFTITVNPVNDRPTFNTLGDQGGIYNGGPQTVLGFITSPQPGPSNETGQTITYEIIGNSNPGLFEPTAGLPAISNTGTLTYTPATDVSGSTTITVVAHDSGGAANGGEDTSTPRTFVITVGPSTVLKVTNLTVTSTGFVVDFNLPINTAALNLYDLNPDIIFRRAGSVPALKGSVVVDSSLLRLTYVLTNGRLPADDYTLTLRSAADGFVGTDGTLLDGNSNNVPGDNYVNTFTVEPSAGPIAISIPNFARGPNQPVNLPASATTGIPVSFSNGGGLLSASFQIRYNPALLNITGATIAPGMPAGTSVALFSFTPGVAEVLFTSQDPLPSGITRFIDVQANVPSGAPYRSKHVLDIANISLSDNQLAIDDDGLAVVAYFGDTTANGTYSSQDATRISRLATGADSGLQTFRLLDPVIVADITGNGSFSATDTTRVLQRAAAIPQVEIPPLPVPAVSLVAGGPDPKLSIPRDLSAAPGQSLEIPVHIDSIVDLTGNGMESADLAIFFDPQVIEVTSVSLGDLVGGADTSWMIASRIDPLLGRVFVSLASFGSLEGVFAGELVKLHATVKADAPAGSAAINLAASAPTMGVTTHINEGWLTLIPAPTDAADDPIDGLLRITAPLSNSNVATTQMVNGHLVVDGTPGDDVLLVGRLSPTQVVVRSAGRLLGTFPMPLSVNIDGMSGRDYINVDAALPYTVVGTADSDAAANIAADVIVSPPNAARVVSPLPNRPIPSSGGEYVPDDSPQDVALLQLLAQWSADDEWEITPAGRRRR